MKKIVFIIIGLLAINSSAAIILADSAGTGTIAQGRIWDQAMNADTLKQWLNDSAVGGDIVYVKGSKTFIFGADIDMRPRTSTITAPISIISVKAATTDTGTSVAVTDWCSDTADMPLLNFGADYRIYLDTAMFFYGMRTTGAVSTAPVVVSGVGVMIENCVMRTTHNVSTTRHCLDIASNSNGARVVNCYFQADSAYGLVITGSGARVINCVFDDFKGSVSPALRMNSSSYAFIKGCIFKNMKSRAIDLAATNYHTIINCTFYNNGKDIVGSTGAGELIMDNVHDSTKVDAVVWSTQTNSNYFYGNHGDDTRCNDMWDGVPATGLFSDRSQTTGDPLFISAPANLRLGTGSPAKNTASNPR
jgi:hypothetical protein